MLVQPPPEPRYGEIEVDSVKYKFRLKKSNKTWGHIVLLNFITEKFVKELIKVPKNLTIGAPVDTGENKLCLLRSEIKPPLYWGKALHYSRRR